MSKVITFSRVFPSYHPRAGEPTYFVEKIVAGLVRCEVNGCGTELIKSLRNNDLLSISTLYELYKGTYGSFKYHTVRSGHRWKVGDKFSPRVWSGKPYRSKQIQFAPEIEVKKVWDLKIVKETDGILESYEMMIDDKWFISSYQEIWTNDGLTYNDFCDWFKMDKAKNDVHFDGQIISWSDQINY